MDKQIAAYIRVSTDQQSTGLESQLRAIRAYCELRGLPEPLVYSDEGVSGAKSSRPALDALLADIGSEKIGQVLTYSLSRLSRSTTHLLSTLELFKVAEVEFISITETISLNTPAGKMLVTVLAAVAELERSLIVERVKSGLLNAKSKGVRLGRPMKRDRRLIRQLLESGMTYREIARAAKVSKWCVWDEARLVSEEAAAAGLNTPITNHSRAF